MEGGARYYMMSKQGYDGGSIEYWPPHLMFFYSDIPTQKSGQTERKASKPQVKQN